LLGISNLYHATVVAPALIDADGVLIATNDNGFAVGTRVAWSIRPERVKVRSTNLPGDGEELVNDAALPGTLSDIADVGTALDLFVALSPHLELQVRTTEPITLAVGDQCRVVLARDFLTVWPAELSEALI
jgi:ABC-type Fe3+/spermidine/putrescine transport system ATPase subunit